MNAPDLYAAAVQISADLIRIDTRPGRPERAAAEYVAERLTEVGSKA